MSNYIFLFQQLVESLEEVTQKDTNIHRYQKVTDIS